MAGRQQDLPYRVREVQRMASQPPRTIGKYQVRTADGLLHEQGYLQQAEEKQVMDRTKYLNMCRECAMIKSRGLYGIRQNVPDRLLVSWQNREYYPHSYELAFNDDGTVNHIAVLHDLTANSISHVPLMDVREKEVIT